MSLLKTFLVVGLSFILIIVISILRTLILHQSPVTDYCNFHEGYYVSDKSGLLKRFSESIKFRTVSYSHHNYESEAISNFIGYISKSFPLVHSSEIITREVVNNFSLLYHVQGSNIELKPYMLTAHLDVVPVEESKWSVDPFSGKIDGNFLWGRGTMDCKSLVMGIMEALEFLLKKGYQPQRSFYIAFGHDEEVDGLDGAQYISKLLKSRNVKLEYILDEGSVVADRFLPGLNVPVAFIGISEKGSLNLELSVNEVPGHSSLPSKETSIVILAKAISNSAIQLIIDRGPYFLHQTFRGPRRLINEKLEGDIFPSMFGKGPEKEMLEEMAYAAVFPLKVVLSNIWLFKPFIVQFMSSPVMSAFHRTTVAVTMINGGTKINVLPSSVSAKINIRIHPAQTVDEVTEYVKKIINDDRIQISAISSFRPHPVSPVNSFGYRIIKKSIRQIYNDSCVVPCTLIANTDTKWYLDLSDSIYRFSLLHIILDDLKRIHGHNERISVTNYMELVNFFVHLIKNSNEASKVQHAHIEL